MAVTMIMEKKLNRVEIIKTACSHGWFVSGILLGSNKGGITKANIQLYSIQASMDGSGLLVVYQPPLNEMTIMGPNSTIEKKLKNKIGDIFEKQKLGVLYQQGRPYLDRVFKHFDFKYLTMTEVENLVKEVEADQDLIYIR